MTNERIKRMLTLLATLAAAAVFAAGCGGDDNDDNGGGGGGLGDTTPQTDAPASKDEAIDRCNEEADKLEGQAKDTAQAACRAAETGNTDEVKEQVKQQCLDASKQIQDDAARKQAEDACEKFGD